MGNKTGSRRATSCELPRDTRAEAILEFVFNDEEEALCSEECVLSHQRAMPAIQEFLQEMSDLDAQSATARRH